MLKRLPPTRLRLRRLKSEYGHDDISDALVEHIDYVKADGKEDPRLTAEFIDTHSF